MQAKVAATAAKTATAAPKAAGRPQLVAKIPTDQNQLEDLIAKMTDLGIIYKPTSRTNVEKLRKEITKQKGLTNKRLHNAIPLVCL